MPVRSGDMDDPPGLHWVTVLFRVMAGLLVLLMVLQVTSGLGSAVEISYGVLFAEAIRLIIFAGLLWGGADLVDLFVKSHHDVRASRILLGRIAHFMENPPASLEPRSNPGTTAHGRGDGVH